MYLNPGGSDTNPDGTDDNFGPHCRNCHTGASSCNQCHGTDAAGNARGAFSAVPLTDGKGPFQPNAFVHTSAVAGLNGQCVDGGFSWPHRTLGANMLKDELYGVDYDGTPVAAGEDRDATIALDLANYANAWGRSWLDETSSDTFTHNDGWDEDGVQLTTSTPIAAENLDSVCIDCHGDSTYWNGDDPATYSDANGWDLLFKGLP